MKKKSFSLIEFLVVIVVILLIVGGVGTCVYKFFGSKSSEEKIITSLYENKLRAASTIEIKEKVMTMAKHYELYVEEEKIGEVTGKFFKEFGDVFTLKTVDGKILASEKECKRFLKLSRAAICYDAQGKVTGYIGEEKFRDLFSWGYIFHFYDSDKKEIGKSQKIGKTFLNIHYLYDNEGNVDYEIDKKAAIVSDRYILTKKDFESSIPLEYAIFITCIEDAIADAN